MNGKILGRIFFFLRNRPIICMLLLSPGIPEYLSSSSPINAVVLNPFQFIFQLLANLGLYGPGVLLIREAMIRWKKGWASVLLLGAAYGILEEGVALSTLFNPMAQPVGQLGLYGHWLGVNWIWTSGILTVHMIYSISLPILLLGLALPQTRGKCFFSKRGIVTLFAILGLDVTLLFLLVVKGENFWMGWPVFLSSFAAIGVLVYLARRTPARKLMPSTDSPKIGPIRTGIIGVVFYPSILIVEFVAIAERIPASIDLVLVVLVQLIFLVYVLRVIGRQGNERQLIALALGLILPIASFGVIAEIRLPLTLVLDVVMILFFRKLWRKYGSPSPRVLETGISPDLTEIRKN